MKKKDDWWCPTCQFTIWGSKPKCLKCGYEKPKKVTKVEPPKFSNPPKSEEYWTPGNTDPKYDRFGPYSNYKGGYYGDRIEGEPEGLIYPNCGCDHLEYCPKRHHQEGCNCYTCRGKPHKW